MRTTFTTTAILVLASLPASAAISLTAGGYLNPFTVNPVSPADFSTTTVVGSANTAGNAAGLDGQIQTIAFSTVNTALPSTATSPPGTDGVARYNTTLDLIQTRPTGVVASILMATVTNSTGSPMSGLNISYDLARISTITTEQVSGHRFYVSTTGATNGWTAIGTYATDGAVSIPVTFSVAAGANFYLLWADDNADPGTDDALTIDNLSLTAINVPEPTTALFSALSLGACLFRRTRQSTR